MRVSAIALIPELQTILAGELLVQRLIGGMSQPFDFVLNHQFSALQFKNLQVVGGEVDQSIV